MSTASTAGLRGPDDAAQGLRPIVLYGAGGLALVLHECLAGQGYRLMATFSDYSPKRALPLPGPLVVGRGAIERWLDEAGTQELSYAISIGNQHRARLDRHRHLQGRKLRPVTVTHPTSFVSPSAAVGAACQILAFAFVGAAARIGEAVVINSRASVDHECWIGDGAYLGPGAVLAGEVDVGECTLIGAGAVVLPGVRIAADTVVGAGAVVTRDITKAGTYAGVPARSLK